MRRLHPLALGLAIAACSPGGRALTGPLAPAARGQAQCYSPDVARKTCESMATYWVDAAGVIQNGSAVMLAPRPLVIMNSATPVALKDGRVCGRLDRKDIEASRFTVDGAPADPRQDRLLRDRVGEAMKPYLGREICTAYAPRQGGFIARATVDGAPLPDRSQTVIWVANDGAYRVGQ